MVVALLTGGALAASYLWPPRTPSVAPAATPLGWILGLGFGAFPLVVSLRLFPLLARDDQPPVALRLLVQDAQEVVHPA